MTKETPAKTSETTSQQIGIHRIYIKSSKFEAAVITPDLLQKKLTPQIDVQFAIENHARGNEDYEVVLNFNLTAKQEGNLLWQLNLQQAGLYRLANTEEKQRHWLMHSFCANQLYGYALAEATHLVQQGGFPPLVLMPIDFGRLYEERVKEQLEKEAAPKTSREVTH